MSMNNYTIWIWWSNVMSCCWKSFPHNKKIGNCYRKVSNRSHCFSRLVTIVSEFMMSQWLHGGHVHFRESLGISSTVLCPTIHSQRWSVSWVHSRSVWFSWRRLFSSAKSLGDVWRTKQRWVRKGFNIPKYTPIQYHWYTMKTSSYFSTEQ